jgi:hypothetical protein
LCGLKKVFPKFFRVVFMQTGLFLTVTQIIVDWIKKDTTVPYEIYRSLGPDRRDAMLYSSGAGAIPQTNAAARQPVLQDQWR